MKERFSRTMVYFETERLLVRSYTPEDLQPLFQIMKDTRVHTHTKDRDHPWDETRTNRYIQFMINKDSRTLDCFHGAVIEKSTDQLIGLCGLNLWLEAEPEIEFKLGVPFWGKGYASELCHRIIRQAFATTAIKGIYGIARPENIASRRVLEKCGMTYLGDHTFRDHIDSFYFIEKP